MNDIYKLQKKYKNAFLYVTMEKITKCVIAVSFS